MKRIYVKQLLLAMLLVFSAATYAQTLSTVTASSDGTKLDRLLVNISNPDYTFAAIEFRAYFEGGVELKQSSNGKYSVGRGSRITSYYDEDSEETTYSHVIESALQSDGSVKVLIYSGSNTLFTGTEGDVAKLNISATSAADGVYPFSLKNVIISSPDIDPNTGEEYLKQVLADYTAYLVVEGGAITAITTEAPEDKPDYSAEIAALQALVAEAQATHDAAVEGTANGEYPAGAKAALQAVINEVTAAINADIDLDTINTLTAQINAAVTEFEGKVITNAGGGDEGDDDEGDDDGVTLSTVSASLNIDKQRLLVNISNPDYTFAAIEFRAYFEGGIELKKSSSGKYSVGRGSRITSYYDEDSEETTYSHVIESALQADGSVKVLIYSGSNTLFTGTEGDVATLSLSATSAADGVYPFSLKNVIISSPDIDPNTGEEYLKQVLADYTAYLVVEGGAITAITTEAPEDKPDYSAEIAALQALVAEAQATHNAAVEGTANGEYPAGAKAALQAVIDEVTAAINADIDLDTINTLTAQINAAVTEFEGKVITNAGGGDDEDEPTVDDPNNTLSIVNTVARAGRQVTLSVQMDNTIDNAVAFGFKLHLPAGFSVALDEDGYELIDVSDRNSNHMAECNTETMVFACYSNKNAVISGNSGEVLTITLDVAADVADGYHTIEMSDIEIADSNDVPYATSLKTSEIYVYSYILGDVNDDGKYSIVDVTGALNLYLAAAAVSENYAADYNEDGKFSITDVTSILNLYLNAKVPTMTFPEHVNNAPAYISATTRAADENYLTIEPFAIAPGEEIEIPVLLYNTVENLTAFGFDIQFPDGISIATDEDDYYLVDMGSRKNKKHSCEANYLEQFSAYRIASYSSRSEAFKGESGEDVLLITLKASDDIKPGEYTVKLFNVELADTEDNPYNPADREIKITVTDTTGIDGIEADGSASSEAIYDLTGRKVAKMVKGGIYIKGGKKFIAQ